MLYEEPDVQDTLLRIVQRVSNYSESQEDLMQEGLIHLWVLENQHPGQTLSWYLQSCQFHLINHLKAGRSVDSPKRRALLFDLPKEFETEDEASVASKESVVEEVSARELSLLLFTQLTSQQQSVFTQLHDGFGVREIARRSGISHPAILKQRRKIAAAAQKVGIIPSPIRTQAV